MLEPLERVHRAFAGRCKIAGQLYATAKADRERLVARRRHIRQKFLHIVEMALVEPPLAGADIRDRGKRERHVQAARKERNALWDAVFKHLKIVLRQVARQLCRAHSAR